MFRVAFVANTVESDQERSLDLSENLHYVISVYTGTVKVVLIHKYITRVQVRIQSRILTEFGYVWLRGTSGVTRLQWARVQVFQKGPLFPKKTFIKTASGKFWAPHSAGPPACTARLARPIVTPLRGTVVECIGLGPANFPCLTLDLQLMGDHCCW